MDDGALRAQVARHGPQLVHWVASVPDIAAAHAALAARGVDRGEIITAGRPTPFGLLEWRITVRPDGARLMDGCLPTLIRWGERHPCHSLPDSGVTLLSLELEHPRCRGAADRLRRGGRARAAACARRAVFRAAPRGDLRHAARHRHLHVPAFGEPPMIFACAVPRRHYCKILFTERKATP